MALRVKQALATIYDTKTNDTGTESKASKRTEKHYFREQANDSGCGICGRLLKVHPMGVEPAEVAQRREELRLAEKTARRSSGSNRERETEMANQLKADAEAMTASELKAALKEKGVTGYSKMKHGELVAEFVKASKPPKASRNGTPREPSENQVRVPSPIEWVSDDGTYSGKSPSANWNGSRWQIGKYFAECGYDRDDVKAALANAKEKLDGGAKSVQALNVKIKVTS